jgi:hypothetical protein
MHAALLTILTRNDERTAMNAMRQKGTYAGMMGARGLARAKRQPAIKGKRAVGTIQPIGLGKAGPGPKRQYLVGRSFGHQGLRGPKKISGNLIPRKVRNSGR